MSTDDDPRPLNRRGRPSKGLTETASLIHHSRDLRDRVRADAEASGLELATWWRSAAEAYLRRNEVARTGRRGVGVWG